MIFYGSRASRIKEGQINNVTCPGCDNSTSMNYAIFGKYAHVYWIPLFPVGKEKILECNFCNRTYDLKELPEQIQHKFELEKQGAGYPIWYFSGLAIIAGIIALVSYNSSKHDEDVINYINEPQVGDMYSIEGSEDGYYTSMKVDRVTQDSVFVIYNDYEIDSKYSKSKLNAASNFSGETTDGFSREELQILFDEKAIYDVNRD